MQCKKLPAILLCAAFVCFPQVYSISGLVTAKVEGIPIAEAVVRLEKAGITAVTDSNGYFILDDATEKYYPDDYLSRNIVTASLHNSSISLHLKEQGDLELSAYTPRGRKISHIRKRMCSGLQTFRKPPGGQGILFYKVDFNGHESVFKTTTLNVTSGKTVSATQQAGEPVQAARGYFPIDDVIHVSKPGYIDYRVMVTNSDTFNIRIMMLVCADTVRDIDGNVYQAVKIGDQIWTIQNLRTTRYNDGTAIPHVTDSAEWCNRTTPAYCFYNNTTDPDSITIFGALYNYYTVRTFKLAPAGWAVPSVRHWDALKEYCISICKHFHLAIRHFFPPCLHGLMKN